MDHVYIRLGGVIGRWGEEGLQLRNPVVLVHEDEVGPAWSNHTDTRHQPRFTTRGASLTQARGSLEASWATERGGLTL